MRLTQDGKRFVAVSTFDERDLPKGAGFRWDSDRRQWWTTDVARASKLARFADETCQAHLAGIAAARTATLEASRATDAQIDVPVPEGLAYLPFQRAGIAYASSRPATLLADQMGLGKTVEAIGVINADPTVRRVIVVCPASLRLNWQRELTKWLVRPLTVGLASTKAGVPATAVVVVNYDILHLFPALLSEQWDIVIVDEAHYIKSRDARRSVAVAGKFDKKSNRWVGGLQGRRRLLLTGTPIVNRPAELWNLIHYLDPDADAWRSFWTYAKRYCDAHRNGWGWELGGATNLDELQERLRSTILVRRLKSEVLAELPPKRRQVIEIPANGAASAVRREREVYEQSEAAVDQLRAAVELAKASENPEVYRQAVEALRKGIQVEFTQISRVRHETALAKVPSVLAHLHDALDEGGEKVVCFAHHHDVIAAIVAEFGDRAVVLTGETPLAERQAAVDRFQVDPTCLLIVGSITAAGVGLTLTASAHVVFAELDWVPGNVTQAEDRTHRIGQRGSVLVQHLVLEGSLDSTLAKTLVRKQAVIDQTLDERPDEVAEDLVPDERAPATKGTSREAIEKAAADVTPEQAQAVLTALRRLAARDGDRAEFLNGVGFSRVDGTIGHSLAACSVLTPKQAVLGRRIVAKYSRQLGDDLLAAAGVKAAERLTKGP